MNPLYGIQGVRRLLLVQLISLIIVALFAMMFVGFRGGYSAVFGGLVYILPNAFYAKKLFQYQGARAARQIVNSFYKGEALKISLSIGLFALVFAVFNVNPMIFFGTYIGMQMLIWFAPLIFKRVG